MDGSKDRSKATDRSRATLESPKAMGWYVAWRQGPAGELPPSVYFCVEGHVGDVQCMSARPSEDEEFVAVCHASFAGAYWLGPYRTRKEAIDVVEAAKA